MNRRDDRLMPKLHLGALALFAIALVFYVIDWLPGMAGFAAFGMLFEVAAWIAWLVADRAEPPSGGSLPTVEAQTSSEPVAPAADRRD